MGSTRRLIPLIAGSGQVSIFPRQINRWYRLYVFLIVYKYLHNVYIKYTGVIVYLVAPAPGSSPELTVPRARGTHHIAVQQHQRAPWREFIAMNDDFEVSHLVCAPVQAAPLALSDQHKVVHIASIQLL